MKNLVKAQTKFNRMYQKISIEKNPSISINYILYKL